MKSQKEHFDQVQVINWCELNKKLYPCLGFIYAIPNAGQRHPAVGAKMKAEGLKKGMLDLCLPWPKEISVGGGSVVLDHPIFHTCGLYIEMKAKPNGKLTPEQKEWIAYLLDVGYEVKVAWSADEAIGYLKEYVNPEETRWIDFN